MYENIKKLFDDLVITSVVFSIYSKLGPEPIFVYPEPSFTGTLNFSPDKRQRSYNSHNILQIAVKSLLILGDFDRSEPQEGMEQTQLFGILPYPDMNAIALTYFTYFNDIARKRLMPASFSLLVDESKRSFLYDHAERLQNLVKDFALYLIAKFSENNIFTDPDYTKIMPLIEDNLSELFKNVFKVQEKPISPITKNRRIKIVFTGLEGSGKTSFLSVINKKFSQLINILPTQRPIEETLNLMGSTIIRWDIPGKKSLREESLLKTEMYLFECDILYYFVDVTASNLPESIQFFQELISHLQKYENRTPVILVLSKVDEDISQKAMTRTKISTLVKEFASKAIDRPFKSFEISIFAPYTVLNAFSYGIRQLSPNRFMLEHLLKEFLQTHQQLTGLLINENGLVLAIAELEDQQAKRITVRQIFEMTAPHFTTIVNQYSEVLAIDGKTTQFHFSDEDLALLKRFTIERFMFYLLFYTKKKESLPQLEKDFPHFIERIENLIKVYII